MVGYTVAAASKVGTGMSVSMLGACFRMANAKGHDHERRLVLSAADVICTIYRFTPTHISSCSPTTHAYGDKLGGKS